MRYRDNTVKGTRRGKKWPAEVKIAAMCDLLICNNLSEVARRASAAANNSVEYMRRRMEARRQSQEPPIYMEHEHGGEDDG